MNMTKLSVSSVILATVLSGCSQQQVIGGSQVVNSAGGSQMSNGTQLSGGSQMSGVSQLAGGSQQQIDNEVASAVQPQAVIQSRPVVKRAPVRVYNKPQVRRVAKTKNMSRSIRRGNGLPAAKPGQCFAKVKTPAKYVTKSKRILIQKSSAQRVLVRAPQYRWIAKKVLVRKAQYVNRTIPAVYRNQTTRVLVRPAYHTWRKGHGAITRIDNMTGEIMCRVTVPAQYKNVTKRVQVRAAQNVRKFIPAVYKTVKQKKRVSAALYKTVNRPARYKTQNYRVKVAAARYVWRPVLCKTNAPKHYKQKVAVMQRAMKRSHKKHFIRQHSSNAGISYAQYLAVMNTPIKAKKKAVKKKINKKVMMPKTETMEATPKKPVMAPLSKTKDSVKAMDTTKKKDSKTDIQQNIVYGIQAALKSKGYNPGKLDGKMGPNTAKALKSFQKSRGLPVGVLSKDTFRALGLVK